MPCTVVLCHGEILMDIPPVLNEIALIPHLLVDQVA